MVSPTHEVDLRFPFWQQWFVASEPQGHEQCSGTSRPVNSLDMSRDVSAERSRVQGSLSTRNEHVPVCLWNWSRLWFNHHIHVKTRDLFYMQSVSFLLCVSDVGMNIIQRWFLKHFCSTALTCTSIWICKWLISYNKKKLVFLLRLWVLGGNKESGNVTGVKVFLLITDNIQDMKSN